ncbi:phospholipase D-like domain-containing protein [Nocardia nova]|uniref:phospholipase D-like domain-containing protein n=1 Tax=Nocardia nova TaxID=37330 RepID=UPI00371A4FC5
MSKLQSGAPSIEDIVRRFSSRPGYRLVAYRQVGLPFWQIPLRCRLVDRKPLPVIDEFILKAVDAELRRGEDIAEFLTLPVELVEGVMADLIVRGKLVAVPQRTDFGTVGYVLSESGRTALREMSEISVQEAVLSFNYDGLTAKYVHVEKWESWRPRELRDQDALAIPAFPADPPAVGPDNTTEVRAAAERIASQRDRDLRWARRDILTVLGVEGKREKRFRKALALVFASVESSDDISVQFIIDGRASEEHDQAFARANGRRKLGIGDSLLESHAVVDALLGPDLVRQRSDERKTAVGRLTESYRGQLTALRERATGALDDQREDLEDQIAEVASKLDALESMQPPNVRVLEVHDHPPLLMDAISSAESRLMIVSPWIRAAVVDDKFVTQLDTILERGVQVVIGFGLGEDGAASDRDRGALHSLEKLESRYRHFRLARLGDTHAKVLIVDQKYAVVTSFNWLSFRGDPTRPFRDERGTYIGVEGEIDRLWNDYEIRITSAKERHRNQIDAL